MKSNQQSPGKVPKPNDPDPTVNNDKKRKQPAVNQGISNAGPSDNRNDRSDKSNNSPDGNKGKPGNRSGTKSNAS